MKKIWLLCLAIPLLLIPACSSEPGEEESAPAEETAEGEEGAAPGNTE